MKPPVSILDRASSVSWFLATRLALVLASALVAATVNDVVEIGFEHRASPYVEPVPSPARVDDFPIATPEPSMHLYRNLQEATEVRVDIRRDGRPMRLTYWIDR